MTTILIYKSFIENTYKPYISAKLLGIELPKISAEFAIMQFLRLRLEIPRLQQICLFQGHLVLRIYWQVFLGKVK